MPRRYRLQYLPLFWDDLEEAVFYVRDVLKNPAAAERLLDRTEEAVLEHAKAPTMAQVYKTTRDRPLPYYWFAVDNYMVFYVVMGDVMEVRRFIYGARDLAKMLP
ncbi:MAG: type II toxin-antitoxin system RelE/ParE family toxin [Atopobiaceae bacterium]|nr:type II toxin-antitoxin system RelE/ParE family toxin [Atopobiaceae bacterium]